MKPLIISSLLLLSSSVALCQDKQALTIDPESGKYSYSRVIELPGHTKDAIRKATIANSGGVGPNTMRNDEDWYIYSLKNWRLAGDAYLNFVVRCGFKDGKLRVEVTDFSYDNRAWGFSAPEKFENIEKSNKLNKVLEDSYERIDKAMVGATEKIKTNLRLTGDKDW